MLSWPSKIFSRKRRDGQVADCPEDILCLPGPQGTKIDAEEMPKVQAHRYFPVAPTSDKVSKNLLNMSVE